MSENKKKQNNESCHCNDNCHCGDHCECNEENRCHDDCHCHHEHKKHHCNKEKKEPPHKSLEKRINELEVQIKKEQERYHELLKKYEHDQQDFVAKLTKKANEANQLLESKIKTLQERSAKDIQNIKMYAIEPYANSLIDIINQFENAINFEVKDEKVKNYQNGFKLFLTMFKNCLNDMSIEKIPVKVGDEFDGQTMECLDSIEASDVKSNHVAQIVTTGYKLHDRVIKPTLVKIAK